MTNEFKLGSLGCMIGMGPRKPGFLNRLKYHRAGAVRRYLFVYHMYRYCLTRRFPGPNPRMGKIESLWFALRCE